MTTSNRFAESARTAKTEQFVKFLIDRERSEGAPNDQEAAGAIADFVATADNRTWMRWAAELGEHPPSQIVKNMVVDQLRTIAEASPEEPF